MALICMVVYCTKENGKDQCLERSLRALENTITLYKENRIAFSVNGATKRTRQLLERFDLCGPKKIFYHEKNLGTAGGINAVMKERKQGEHFVKIDEDIVINNAGWIEQMAECIARDRKIGVIGLKRKDLIQSPTHPDPQFRSEFFSLPHKPGEKWLTIERTPDVIGSCTMFNSALIDKIGYSRQPGLYGFEDNLYCHRSHLAGFYNCFLPHIDIDHIDPGGTDFQTWKEKHSQEKFSEYHKLVHAMINGTEPIYYNPFES